MAIAGHVSPKMLKLYSHVRIAPKRTALDTLSGGGSRGSYGTKNDTNTSPAAAPNPQVIETQMVGPWGLEPQTSTVSIKRSEN